MAGGKEREASYVNTFLLAVLPVFSLLIHSPTSWPNLIPLISY